MILIDKKMPASCEACEFIYEDSNMADCCMFTHNKTYDAPKGKRHADCPLKEAKQWFTDISSEIKTLARFHSVDVPIVYGDGEESTDKMISLGELGIILSEIEIGSEEAND